MIILGFYKYTEIMNPDALMQTLQEFCSHIDIRGTILLSKEGVNASVSGDRSTIDSFRSFITSIKNLNDLYFKEETSLNDHPFKKMKIKVKKEIVRFDSEVSLENRGKHISSDELIDLYDDSGSLKKDVILIDTRNDYEYEVGRFRGAIHLQLKTFREFTKKIKINTLKNKKVVMYCTGGVRCEKATAYVKEQGVEDVFQLHQGIIQFGKEHQNSYWEGRCFVFDKRMMSPMNSERAAISKCYICGEISDFQRNCRNRECDRFYISCSSCEEKFNKCCSKSCMQAIM